MSESSFTGTIKNFSPKPNEDYYGLFIDNGNEEKWLNGQGNIPRKWNKGDKVKVKANMDEFIEIQEIDIIGGANKDEATRGTSKREGKSEGGGSAADSYTSKDDRINKKVAFKEAAETLRQQHEELKIQAPEEGGEHIQVLSKLANGYYNILQNLGDEK